MSRMLWSLYTDERGQDLIEYALLASFIALVSIASLKLLGQAINSVFVLVKKGLG